MAVAVFSSNATERVELPVAWLLLIGHTARRGMHGLRLGSRSYDVPLSWPGLRCGDRCGTLSWDRLRR